MTWLAARRSDERWRFAMASLAGAMVALLLFTWLGARGRPENLLEWQRQGAYYDEQAKAWLDGHWAMDAYTLNIERFDVRGQSYMYQGPWPAVLRVPIVALTDRYIGRVTLLSMIGGMAVALAAATRLHWRVRVLVRGPTRLSRLDLWVAGIATFAVGGGSALLYEASRPWVYHEAAVWGAAWSLAAIDAAVGCVTRPTARRFAWAALVTALALTSRFSVGLAGVAALALLAGGNALARLGAARSGASKHAAPDPRRRWYQALAGAPEGPGRSLPVLLPTLAAAVPLAVYATVNWIKFRSLFSVPFYQQGFTQANPQRQHFLDVNDGTLFGLKFAPTTFVQYVRPDALSFTRTFPFVDFPARAQAFGGIEFDLIDYSSSAPTTMPVFALLGLVAAVALLRRATSPLGRGVAALRGPSLGALAGALTILPFGYIANRYLADCVPALTIAALLGVHVLLHRGGSGRTRARRVLGGALLVLLAAGTWVNLSHALIFQRLYSPNVKDDILAQFLDTRYDLGQRVGADPPLPLIVVDDLPRTAPRGTIAITGDCSGLYLSDGLDLNPVKITPWNAVERTEDGGRYLRTITFPVLEPGTRVPLFTMRSPEGDGVLYVESMGGPAVQFNYVGPGQGLPSIVWFIPDDETFTLDLVADPQFGFVQVHLDDKLYYETLFPVAPDELAIGRDILGDPNLEDAFPGRLDPLPERAGLCREILAEADR